MAFFLLPDPTDTAMLYFVITLCTLQNQLETKSSCAAQEYWHQYMLDIIQLYVKMHCLSMIWASEHRAHWDTKNETHL
jgi:hypothetical protein